MSRRQQIAASAVTLFLANLYVCRELFALTYTRYYGSIEAAYISIAHWIVQHPSEFSWFPLWYGGIPYANTYPPLLHWIVGYTALATGWTEALAYHAVTALTYCLGPLALFCFALRLSGSVGRSFAGALLYSCVSPSLWLVEAFRGDAGGWDAPRRLHALLLYGEGPHGTAMTLLPLALIALDYALAKRRPIPVYLAALALAAVVLTNWLGAFALAAAVVALLLAKPEGLRFPTLAWAAGIGALSYVLVAVWIPPSNIADIRHNAQYTVGTYPVGWTNVLIWTATAAAALGLRWLLPARPQLVLIRWCALFGLFMAVLTLGDAWFGLHALPQPDRYHVELEIPICLALAWLGGSLVGRVPRPYGTTLATAALTAVAAYGLHAYRGFAAEWLKPGQLTETSEYKAIEAIKTRAEGERLALRGIAAYWLNAFTDNPQFGGGFDQGIVNRTIPAIRHGFGAEAVGADKMIAWLEIYGIEAIAAGGPFHWDFAHERLRDHLPELWRYDDSSALYSIPNAQGPPFRVITPATRPVRTPHDAADLEPVQALLSALRDPTLPRPNAAQNSPNHWTIEANLESEHLIWAQITYHRGWRITANGQTRRILENPLGMMTLEPRCQGPCEIQLIYDGGSEHKLLRALAWAAWLALPLWIWRSRKEPEPPSGSPSST